MQRSAMTQRKIVSFVSYYFNYGINAAEPPFLMFSAVLNISRKDAKKRNDAKKNHLFCFVLF